eukprot:scaffold7306_cov75-Cylindrotheca_fusiformis.AAC.2
MSTPFTFPDFVGDTPLDPPDAVDPATPAGASQASYLTAQSGGGLKDLVLVHSSNDLCCGFVGTGNDKICLKKQSECGVSKHKTSRHVFDDDTLLVRDGPHRGLMDLSIETINLTTAAVERLTALNLTLSKWEELFQGLEGLEDDYQPLEVNQVEQLITAIQSQGAEDDPVLRQTFSVSSSQRVGSRTSSQGQASATPATGSSAGDGTRASSHFSFEEVDHFQRSESTDLEDRMKAVEDHLSQAGSELARDMVEAGNQIAISRSMLEDVVRMVGTSLEARNIEDVDKKSVWGLLGSLAGTIETLDRQQAQIERRLSGNIPTQIADLAKIHQDSWNKFSQVFRTIRASDDLVIKGLQAKVNSLETRLTVLESSSTQGSHISSGSTSSAPTFGTLFNVAPLGSTSLSQATGHTAAGSVPQGQSGTSPAISTGPSQSQLTMRLANLEATVIQLRTELDDLKKQEALRGTGIVRFESLGFQNEHDAAAFVAKHVQEGSLQVGFLFDIYLLCNLVFRMASGDQDFLKLTETINKLDLKTNRAAQAMLAFKSPVPDLFVDGSKEHEIWAVSAKDGSYFNRVKSFAEWKKLRHTLRKAATNVETSTKQRLYFTTPKANRIRSIFEQSITASVACLIDLVDFMDSVISDMQHFGMSEARGFALSTRLGDAFFRECHKVRAAVADDLEAKDPIKLATTLWFAVTQTLDVMNDFRQKHFKEHSAIASEYIQFIVQTTIRDESGDGLDERISDLEQKISDVEKLDKTAKDAKKTADGVKSKMDGVTSKLAGATKDAKDALKGVDSLKSKLSDKGVL